MLCFVFCFSFFFLPAIVQGALGHMGTNCPMLVAAVTSFWGHPIVRIRIRMVKWTRARFFFFFNKVLFFFFCGRVEEEWEGVFCFLSPVFGLFPSSSFPAPPLFFPSSFFLPPWNESDREREEMYGGDGCPPLSRTHTPSCDPPPYFFYLSQPNHTTPSPKRKKFFKVYVCVKKKDTKLKL